MQRIILLLSILVLADVAIAQKADSSYFIRYNQQIDDLVIKQDLKALDKVYANDFVFSHGTGKVEGKTGWLSTVEKTKYLLRQNDSVTAELHPGVAMVRGRLTVQRVDAAKTTRYHLKYVRAYALRGKQWQMISHYTTYEFDEP